MLLEPFDPDGVMRVLIEVVPAAQALPAGGLCAEVDPELFFPENGHDAAEALSVCRRCDITDPCLDWALARGEKGVWGGKSEHERRQLRGAA